MDIPDATTACDLLLLDTDNKSSSQEQGIQDPLPHSTQVQTVESPHNDMLTETLTETAHLHSQVSSADSGLGSLSVEDEDEARPLRALPSNPRSHNHKEATNNTNPTPGVILLGRGNSFSLGRSEVIVLNNRKHSSRISNTKNSVIPETTSDSLDESINSEHHNGYGDSTRRQGDGDTDTDTNTETPPISNGAPREVISNDLELLWAKAEAVMLSKQSAVQRVLEEFGVGEGGEGEEEGVWNVLHNL